MERRELDRPAMDMRFDEELCHSTGYEIKEDGEWWNEFVDSEGNLHYGR